jgi:hypothetical protein
MGALDDAIREHLELKRRHGAPEDEVTRKEKEALQVGALPSDAGIEAPQPEPSAESERVEVEREAIEEVERYDAQPALADSEEPDVPTVGSLEPPGGSLESTPQADLLDELEADEVLPEEALEIEPPPTGAPPEAQDPAEPVPWTADDQINGDRSGDDVLEETPDFLEDLPEQDRLWFEQRSPKDFDFGD